MAVLTNVTAEARAGQPIALLHQTVVIGLQCILPRPCHIVLVVRQIAPRKVSLGSAPVVEFPHTVLY